MPFDGFGNFLRLYSWVVDATNSVKIRADRHDDEDNNFTAGLSNCITKDGQTSVTQNIPLNSRRLISVADPVNAQDAATKAYADTKMPLDGSAPITGDVIIKNADPSITLDGMAGSKNSIFGQKADKNRWEIVLGNATAESGSDAGSDFELINYHDAGTLIGDVLFGKRSTGLLTVKGDPIAALGIATKQYSDTAANSAAAGKLPLAGGTITGNLAVNGELIAVQNYVRFGSSGSPYYLGYLGGNYTAGGNTIWHSGNFNPAAGTGTVSDTRLAMAGDIGTTNAGGAGTVYEPFGGAVMTGWSWVMGGAATAVIWTMRFRYLQIYRNGSWFTVGYV